MCSGTWYTTCLTPALNNASAARRILAVTPHGAGALSSAASASLRASPAEEEKSPTATGPARSARSPCKRTSVARCVRELERACLHLLRSARWTPQRPGLGAPPHWATRRRGDLAPAGTAPDGHTIPTPPSRSSSSRRKQTNSVTFLHRRHQSQYGGTTDPSVCWLAARNLFGNLFASSSQAVTVRGGAPALRRRQGYTPGTPGIDPLQACDMYVSCILSLATTRLVDSGREGYR
eukprot:623554-Prorocentrum_minimum.AAC.5